MDDVSFEVRPGQVVGFLGPNGAGKSTTLRMLCGLSRPDAGTALLDGVPVARLPNAGRAVGVLLDASAVHAGRTVRETVALVAATIGEPPERADRMLEAVGLGRVGRRRAGLCRSECDSGSRSPSPSWGIRATSSSTSRSTASTPRAWAGCAAS
nr:ATP-binding cassette domain-containing protein [Cellulomonas sp. JZ18]